jgi:DTW domain-containing protein YfiP
MFDTEPMKPSNTGRLIADILPDTEAFQWSRTEPPQALLDLVADPIISRWWFSCLLCRGSARC